jgi:hypothetical protein
MPTVRHLDAGVAYASKAPADRADGRRDRGVVMAHGAGNSLAPGAGRRRGSLRGRNHTHTGRRDQSQFARIEPAASLLRRTCRHQTPIRARDPGQGSGPGMKFCRCRLSTCRPAADETRQSRVEYLAFLGPPKRLRPRIQIRPWWHSFRQSCTRSPGWGEAKSGLCDFSAIHRLMTDVASRHPGWAPRASTGGIPATSFLPAHRIML